MTTTFESLRPRGAEAVEVEAAEEEELKVEVVEDCGD